MTSNAYFLSINSQETTVIDPWLPRIQNNDEYLELGLTFAPNGASGDSRSDTAKRRPEFRPLGNLGAIRLADALQDNVRLLSLDLSGNNIGSVGGVALANALCKCTDKDGDKYESRTALRMLNLSQNEIGDAGARAFAQALLYNTSLQHLDVSLNGISLEGIIELLDALGDNQSVKTLNLAGNLKEQSAQDMSKSIEKICSIVPYNQVEEIQMHCDEQKNEILSNALYDSNLGGASNKDIWKLLQAIYSIPQEDQTEESYYNLSDRYKMQPHRLGKLTLPSCNDYVVEASTDIMSTQLLRVLQFNSFYRPILELHDNLNSRSRQYFDGELPNHLQRDVHSGALVGLLPSLNNTMMQQKKNGISFKEMPHVIAFTIRECTLDALWNVLRYRPDVFRYAGKSFRSKGVVSVECGACLIL